SRRGDARGDGRDRRDEHDDGDPPAAQECEQDARHRSPTEASPSERTWLNRPGGSIGRRTDLPRPPRRPRVRVAETTKGGSMALARVVTFENVDSNRMAELEQEMQSGGPPEGLEPQEIIVLHDPEASTSTVILFFEDDEAYSRGDEVLNAMPAGDTPGRRTS